MENNAFKSLGLVLMVVICRSLYLHRDFYLTIWNENKLTILFIGSIFTLLIILLIRFNKLEKIKEEK